MHDDDNLPNLEEYAGYELADQQMHTLDQQQDAELMPPPPPPTNSQVSEDSLSDTSTNSSESERSGQARGRKRRRRTSNIGRYTRNNANYRKRTAEQRSQYNQQNAEATAARREDEEVRAQERENDAEARRTRRLQQEEQIRENQERVARRLDSAATYGHALVTLQNLAENNLPLSMQQSNVGGLTEICEHCQAKRFPGESRSCCNQGNVNLPLIQEPPEEMDALFTRENHSHSMKYLKYYNNRLALSSMVAEERRNPGYNPTLIVSVTLFPT
jgi:hypothetical protein